MRKSLRSNLRTVTIVVLLIMVLAAPFPSIAQSGFPLPPVEVIELSGVEPPPPGVNASVDFAMGGGGLECDPNQAHRIAGTGFTPSIAPGFGLYIECIEDVTVPLVLYVYAVKEGATVGQFVASRSIQPSPARNALVHIRLRRSFPYRPEELELIVNKAGDVISTRPVGATSPCVGSYPSQFVIGGKFTVTLFEGLSLYADPRQLDAPLATLAFMTEIEVLEGPTCGSDGLSYWRIRAGEQIGWLPQGSLALDWIGYYGETLSCEGTLPSTLQSGRRAKVPQDEGAATIFRTDPDPRLPAFRLLPALTTFMVVFGPYCGIDEREAPTAYWLVQLDDGTKGWVMEVTPTQRLLEPA